MCGIVGLLLKDASLRPRLGEDEPAFGPGRRVSGAAQGHGQGLAGRLAAIARRPFHEG